MTSERSKSSAKVLSVKYVRQPSQQSWLSIDRLMLSPGSIGAEDRLRQDLRYEDFTESRDVEARPGTSLATT